MGNVNDASKVRAIGKFIRARLKEVQQSLKSFQAGRAPKGRFETLGSNELHVRYWQVIVDGFNAKDNHLAATAESHWKTAGRPFYADIELARVIRNAKGRLVTLKNFRENSAEASEALEGSPSAMEIIAQTDKDIERLNEEISQLKKRRTEIRQS